jgi:hypothetical protein
MLDWKTCFTSKHGNNSATGYFNHDSFLDVVLYEMVASEQGLELYDCFTDMAVASDFPVVRHRHCSQSRQRPVGNSVTPPHGARRRDAFGISCLSAA